MNNILEFYQPRKNQKKNNIKFHQEFQYQPKQSITIRSRTNNPLRKHNSDHRIIQNAQKFNNISPSLFGSANFGIESFQKSESFNEDSFLPQFASTPLELVNSPDSLNITETIFRLNKTTLTAKQTSEQNQFKKPTDKVIKNNIANEETYFDFEKSIFSSLSSIAPVNEKNSKTPTNNDTLSINLSLNEFDITGINEIFRKDDEINLDKTDSFLNSFEWTFDNDTNILAKDPEELEDRTVTQNHKKTVPNNFDFDLNDTFTFLDENKSEEIDVFNLSKILNQDQDYLNEKLRLDSTKNTRDTDLDSTFGKIRKMGTIPPDQQVIAWLSQANNVPGNIESTNSQCYDPTDLNFLTQQPSKTNKNNHSEIKHYKKLKNSYLAKAVNHCHYEFSSSDSTKTSANIEKYSLNNIRQSKKNSFFGPRHMFKKSNIHIKNMNLY